MAGLGRLFHWLAVGTGYTIVLVLLAGTLFLGVRYVQARYFYVPPAGERLEEKAAYLASMPPARADAPNLVVILFDDLGWGDLGSYGNPLIETPRIDALADEGLRMTRFYSAAPVCTPSRAALLTGRYPIRSNTHLHVFFAPDRGFGILRMMMGWPNDLVRDEILLPEALGAAGYATGMVGKWHLGTQPGHLPNDFGFDAFFGVHYSNDMVPLHLYRDREIVVRDERPGTSFRDEDAEDGSWIDQRRLTDRYTEEAIGFLEANRERPFFLYLAHSFPHVPHFASPAQAGRSEGGVYGDVVADLDRSTGAILDALDRLGLAEDTLVVVTSDNGADYNGAPGPVRGRKGETYEGGQRVPMIVRWPGRIAAGRVDAEPAMQIDFLPTFLAMTGLPLPEDRVIDGRDLGRYWTEGGPSPHDLLFYTSAFSGEVEAVRDRRFKYLAESGDRGRSKPQLWRMDAGPGAEAHNLIGRFPEEGARLAEALAAWRAELEANPRGWR